MSKKPLSSAPPSPAEEKLPAQVLMAMYFEHGLTPPTAVMTSANRDIEDELTRLILSPQP